jgi:hypothetical protein
MCLYLLPACSADRFFIPSYRESHQPDKVIPIRTGRTGGFRRTDSYRYHFDLRVNNQNLYLTSPRTAQKGSSDLSLGEVNPSERHGQDLGNYLD